MGNYKSTLKGFVIEEDVIEASEFWTLHNARMENEEPIRKFSVFKGEYFANEKVWKNQIPLERASKHYMIYRHPCILKYITSWEEDSQKYLCTEGIQTIRMVLPTLTDIQICLGLRNILCGLIFLIEQADVRHLNVATTTIYVNYDREWRLGGFEYVWKSDDVTDNLLELSKEYRYAAGIDKNECKHHGHGIEQYAFGTLCEDLFKLNITFNTPYVTEFREYCEVHLRHQNPAMRPKLSAVLLHPYFNHEFVLIHSFLMELPLKSPSEKQEFFTKLIDRLRSFDEHIIGSMLGTPLLSRIVLLDTTAQLCVLPYILRTKSQTPTALFSNDGYTQHMIPKIKEVFGVRDVQIRLILLEYLQDFIRLMSTEEIQHEILPNLLPGVKDTNDKLVEKTLIGIAHMVSLLGAHIVIGGNRMKLFADGRPTSFPQNRSISPVLGGSELVVTASPPVEVDESESITDDNTILINSAFIAQRLGPDGGEDHQNTNGDIDDETWVDWEEYEDTPKDYKLSECLSSVSLPDGETSPEQTEAAKPKLSPIKKLIDDINNLDIKVHVPQPTNGSEEIDFFKGMEPVIQNSKNLHLSDELLCKSNVPESIELDNARLQFRAPEVEEIQTGAGWGDVDIEDWGE